jgi:curved DNA-binding protein CbpA
MVLMALDFDPYETLGVERDASASDIKRAHRRRAMETHPDRGGDGDEFHRVSRAVAVLSDPEARERYDRTGSAEEPRVDNKLGAAMSFLSGIVISLAEEEAIIEGAIDLVGALREIVNENRNNVLAAIRECEKKRTRLARTKKRFRRIGEGDNFLARALETRARDLKDAQAKAEADREKFELALDLLNDFRFDVSAPAPNWGTFSFPGVGVLNQSTIMNTKVTP